MCNVTCVTRICWCYIAPRISTTKHYKTSREMHQNVFPSIPKNPQKSIIFWYISFKAMKYLLNIRHVTKCIWEHMDHATLRTQQYLHIKISGKCPLSSEDRTQYLEFLSWQTPLHNLNPPSLLEKFRLFNIQIQAWSHFAARKTIIT